jgi:hypothetical protein
MASCKVFFEWSSFHLLLQRLDHHHSIKINIQNKNLETCSNTNQLVCRLMNDKCCFGGDKLHQLFHPKKITLPTNNGCRRCGRSCMTKKKVFIVCIHAYNKQVLKGELNPNPCRDFAHYNLNTTCT